MKTIIYIAVFMLAIVPLVSASQENTPYVGSPALERLKQLVGQWEGTMDMEKGPEKITASYSVTSGGSAIIETVFRGSPHEMVTIYHDDSKRQLSLTHYCMLKNQPKMVLIRQDENSLTFDLSKEADIDVAEERHMHAVTLTMDGPDRMTQRWMEYQDGKPQKSVDIAFQRVK